MTLTKWEETTLYDVKRELDENIQRPKLPLSYLTKFSGFNKDKLSTAFKEMFGESIAHYQIHQRMSLAADLLRNSDLLVKEIAYKVGYHRLHKFIPQFKQYYRCTPTNFRIQFSKMNSLRVESGQ